MISLSSRVLICIFSLFAISTNAFADMNDDANLFPVHKSDGSIGYYRLQPPKYDPAHAAIVRERLMSEKPFAALPANYYIPSELVSPVRDQGRRGTCAYFATLGVVESYYISKDPKHTPLNLSEQCLVGVRNWMFDEKDFTRDDKPTDRPDPNGDEYPSIAKTLNYEGVPAERNYSPITNCTYRGSSPSVVDLSRYHQLFTSATATPSIAYAKGFPLDEDTAPTIQKIKELLARNIPVAVAIVVYNDFFRGSEWYYRNVRNRGSSNMAGGHGVMLVGYHTYSNGATIFKFKNSWGRAWGGSGYGSIDDQLLIHSWAMDPSYDVISSLHD